MSLYDKFLERLIAVNDETVSIDEHRSRTVEFRGWKQGVYDATGQRFNGDFYYLDLIDKGEMKERPMCLGEFLDWRSTEGEAGQPAGAKGAEK